MSDFLNRVQSYSRYLLRTYTKKHRDKKSELLIISYPKSGRTWLRMLLCRYLSQKYMLKNDLDLFRMTSKLNHLLISDFQHEQANHRLKLNPSELKFNHDKYQHKRVVFLSRDPRDTAVSMYFQLKNRETVDDSGYYQGTLSELYQDPRFGLEKIVAFNKMWTDNITSLEHQLCFTYEDMLNDAEHVVSLILGLMGEYPVDLKALQEAVNYSRFDNMKKLEKKGEINHFSMKTADKAETNTKVRKGGSGGYVDYLSQDDLQYTAQVFKQYNV